MLSQLVNIWFQVLFHSPSGVLFNFPSRYYTLSVTRSYLGFGDGPPIFTPDSTCPALLWILARAYKHFTYGAITLFRLVFQKTSAMFDRVTLLQVRTPMLFLTLVWPVARSLAATKAIAVAFFSYRYLDVSVLCVPFITVCIRVITMID